MKTLMVTVTKCSVAHTLRDGNRVADALAKMGYEQDVKLITLVTAPDEVLDMLAADMAGVAFMRRNNNLARTDG